MRKAQHASTAQLGPILVMLSERLRAEHQDLEKQDRVAPVSDNVDMDEQEEHTTGDHSSVDAAAAATQDQQPGGQHLVRHHARVEEVEVLEAVEDRLGEDGKPKTECLELWHCDVVNCVRDIIGNPLLRESIVYAPERHYADEAGRNRVYGNMWMGNWWWNIQSKLPLGATAVPVILASDKTMLSQMSSDKSAWPHHVLEGYQLFHLCMKKPLQPLMDAGKDSIKMTCADGQIRRVFPILAAYIADHPEQCLITACQENYCPKCPDPVCVISAMQQATAGNKPPEFAEWGLPHANIFSALTPDILHQLHKGVFKDHLVSWVTQAIDGGAAENMEKVFLGMVAGAANEQVILAVRSVLDFIYLAHFEAHTDTSLDALHQAWVDFHAHKSILMNLEICEHFNLLKGHSMEHYKPSICSVGTADGYSTEHPEHLHINFAKLAYGASNKQVSYISQMTRWLECQEAIVHFALYLTWTALNAMGNPSPDVHPSGSPLFMPSTQSGGPIAGVPHTAHIPSTVQIAKAPAFPSLSIIQLERDFGATHFKTALADYLKTRTLAAGNTHIRALISTPIHDLAHVAAYKQAKVQLPLIRQVSMSTVIDIIHTSPAHASVRTLHAPIPPNMFTVVAHDPSALLGGPRAFDVSRPLLGLRITCAHCIFKLPQMYDACALGITGPLVYVKWFTPFHTMDTTIGMYIVSPSTQNRQRNVSIIPLSDILRSCHLIPCWGRQIQPQVVAGDILDDVTMKFFVNPHLRHHDFIVFRLLCNT
ncbi:hypothetical protein BC628DRAFT_1409157 [Trametes gibbosa]|nr:hypothetical protein BC628DRAFT_1409157 [Trametes gibbosa]